MDRRTVSPTATDSQMIREFRDATGMSWLALAIEATVAHGKTGTRLAFRPAGQDNAPALRSNVTFNSREAGDFALRTMGEKELRRRLTLAQAEAGTT